MPRIGGGLATGWAGFNSSYMDSPPTGRGSLGTGKSLSFVRFNMAEDAPVCANCGAPLPGLDAICPRCDRELSFAHGEELSGTYGCPNCTRRFNKPIQGWWPPKARWYWPQTMKPQCPHCHAFLRDRTAVALTQRENLTLIAVLIAAAFSPWTIIVQGGVLLVAITVQLLRWRRARSVVAEGNRYAVQEPCVAQETSNS